MGTGTRPNKKGKKKSNIFKIQKNQNSKQPNIHQSQIFQKNQIFTRAKYSRKNQIFKKNPQNSKQPNIHQSQIFQKNQIFKKTKIFTRAKYSRKTRYSKKPKF